MAHWSPVAFGEQLDAVVAEFAVESDCSHVYESLFRQVRMRCDVAVVSVVAALPTVADSETFNERTKVNTIRYLICFSLKI